MQILLTIVNQHSPGAVDSYPATEGGHTGIVALIVIADSIQHQDAGTGICQSTCYSYPLCSTTEESGIHHHWAHSGTKFHGFKVPLNADKVLVRGYGARKRSSSVSTNGPCCYVDRFNSISGYCWKRSGREEGKKGGVSRRRGKGKGGRGRRKKEGRGKEGKDERKGKEEDKGKWGRGGGEEGRRSRWGRNQERGEGREEERVRL